MSYYLPGSPYILSRGFGKGHFGQDWAAPKGTSIPVAADGKVVFSGAERDANGNYKGWGEYVVVEHYDANGNVTGYTLYAHMDSRTGAVGDSVKMGDKIGEVGNTGRSYSTTGGDGSHLHFEVRPIDPNNPRTDRNKDGKIDWRDELPINPGTFTGWDSFKGAYNWILDYFGIGDPFIDPSLDRYFTRATQWRPSRDPLSLDLDGDGIETVGINTNNPILFDHDADGVKTATGWMLKAGYRLKEITTALDFYSLSDKQKVKV